PSLRGPRAPARHTPALAPRRSSGLLLRALFRIIAVIGIGYSLHVMAKRGALFVQSLSVALIFAGAMGNIIDSTFYGLIFSDSTWFEKAQLFPPEGGYSSLFHGKVVDMLYFPIIKGNFPSWFPIWGGDDFLFFRPVFNIADSAITVGVALILLYQKRYFKEEIVEPESYNSEVVED